MQRDNVIQLRLVPYEDAPHAADRVDDRRGDGEASIASIGFDTDEPIEQPIATWRWSRLASTLAAEVIELATHPLWSWGFPGLDREAPIPIGSLVYVVGATGRGKSSFLAQVARHHERTAGPALIVSAELAGAIIGARMVSQIVDGATWIDVVRGNVPAGRVIAALDLPKLRIVDDIGADWPMKLDAEIAAMRAEHPDETALVVVDYVQICRLEGRDERERVTGASKVLRDLAKRHRAVIVAISKAARSASRSMRAGEMVGTDATEAGAEAGALEYDAIALVTLGAMAPIDSDDPRGPQTVDLSIAKTRFGAADLVIPFRFDGARGTFEEMGEPVPASQRREDAKMRNSEAKSRGKATGKAAADDRIADRRLLALELAASTGSIPVAMYEGRAGLSHGAAGNELALLEVAGLLSAGGTRSARTITGAGRAVLYLGPEARRVALRRAIGGGS